MNVYDILLRLYIMPSMEGAYHPLLYITELDLAHVHNNTPKQSLYPQHGWEPPDHTGRTDFRSVGGFQG